MDKIYNEQDFRRHINKWRDETGGYSVYGPQVRNHPSCLAIRELGAIAVPLIMDHYSEDSSMFISNLLFDIVGRDAFQIPFEDMGKTKKMREHWFAWWEKNKDIFKFD